MESGRYSVSSAMENGHYELHFRNRFRGASKGSARPTIYSMDWRLHCGEYAEVMAFSTRGVIRAYGRKGSTWSMLMNRKPSGIRKVDVVKWTSRNCLHIAAACSNGHDVTVDLLAFHGGQFKNLKRFEVPKASCASSLSWDSSGNMLLVPLKRDALYPEARMIVFRKQSKNRYTEQAILPKYASHFTAVFHPSEEVIFSTSVESTTIDVWRRDVKTFLWKLTTKISCIQGITDISFCPDALPGGFWLAAIVGKHLMIWRYFDNKDQEGTLHPTVEIANHENDDGHPRKNGVSLIKHCKNIISLAWSSESQLLTGSSLGTMCVHTLSSNDTNGSYEFEVLYYRWSHVHAQNTNGPVTCVSWNLMKHLACAGNDGVVTLWELMPPDFPNLHNRNYTKEMNYFYPGLSSSLSRVAREPDVDSIESIMSTNSDDGSELDLSDGNEADDTEPSVSTPLTSRVQKVLLTQADLAAAISEATVDLKDLLEKMSAVGQNIDTDSLKLKEVYDISIDSYNIVKGVDISVDKLLEKLKTVKGVIKAKATVLESAIHGILPSLQRQKELLDSILSQFDVLDATLLRIKHLLEQTLQDAVTKIETSVLSKKNEVEAKLNSVEKILMDKLAKMEETMHTNETSVKNALTAGQQHTEEFIRSRLHQVEQGNKQRHDDLLSRFDMMMNLLKKPGNASG